MISVTIFKRDQVITGFDCKGHAGYAEEGQDIVCAALSALVINTVNSIETFTGAAFDLKEDDGDVSLRMKTEDPDAGLLLNALELGAGTIAREYGGQYVRVTVVNR